MPEFAQVAAAVGAIVGAPKPAEGGAAPFARPAEGAPATAASETPLEYQRRTKGDWESFSCSCGHLMQLSPSFAASEMKCPKCGRITRVV